MWVATATHRQDRTFLPPDEYCPLCPTEPGHAATEVPSQSYDIAVLENRFPSLSLPEPQAAIAGDDFFETAPARGVCEVVLYTQDHDETLSDLSREQIRKLIDVWTDRYVELSAMPDVRCVFIFENKGVEVGVTLHHPHGQIYAYPFVPPIIETEHRAFREYRAKTGKCLLCETLTRERAAEQRLVTQNHGFSAFVPFAARWPYEVHIVANRHAPSVADLTGEECDALAALLKDLLRAYDALFERPFPYVMAFHQKPVHHDTDDTYHFHVEFYPPLRSSEKLKYLAGSEIGAGMFINDTLPEQTAQTLRAALRKHSE